MQTLKINKDGTLIIPKALKEFLKDSSLNKSAFRKYASSGIFPKQLDIVLWIAPNRLSIMP